MPPHLDRLHNLIPIIGAALWDVLDSRPNERRRRLLRTLIISLVLWYCTLPPRRSIVPWWRLCTKLITSQWVRALQWIAGDNSPSILPALVHGGPLGTNCAKACQVLAAMILWQLLRTKSSPLKWLGCAVSPPWPPWTAWAALLVFSFLVNGIMYLWSTTTTTASPSSKSTSTSTPHESANRGRHVGIHEMVESTQGRALHWKEHMLMSLLAFANAVCEEVTSRWFWRLEFEEAMKNVIISPLESFENNNISEWAGTPLQIWSNVLQAALFGLWHYNGIPSGVSGVLLTFVYGLIMGRLSQCQFGSDGAAAIQCEYRLLLPIATHALADYFIFTSIARRRGVPKEKIEQGLNDRKN